MARGDIMKTGREKQATGSVDKPKYKYKCSREVKETGMVSSSV
jgi:hypothetical protein